MSLSLAPLSPPDTDTDALFATTLHRATTRQLDAAALLQAATALAAHPGRAAHLYKAWIACNAGHPGLHILLFNYAVCLADSHDLPGAANALRHAIQLQPAFAPPSINLGGILERLGHPGQAVETWFALLATLGPITPDALRHKVLTLKQIGRVLESTQQDDAAENALRQCLALDPHQPDAIQHYVALRQRQCKWPVLDAPDPLTPARLRASLSPLSAAYLTDDPIFHLAIAHHYARTSIPRPALHLPRPHLQPCPDPVPPDPRPLRIGYVSSDLRDHAVGFALTDLMELHDRTRVEVSAYYCGIPSDDTTQRRIRRAVDRWTDLTGLDDDQAAQRVRADGIDILVDLNGYTKDARTGLFARRPAPIAVNWFGFPGTMATPYHHYIIADAQVIPPKAEIYYAERVLRLPCYQPNDRHRSVAATRPTRAEAGLPGHAMVFCALNGMQKLGATTFDRWLAILAQVPGSVLWLLAGTQPANDRLRAAAQARGIDPARLVFAPKMANPDHLARLPLADLFLDSFPYGAHTTASDALWMGLPVLTLQGRSFAARVCASLVTAAGLPELVATTPDAYVAQAVRLAQDPAGRDALRHRLAASRDTCPLFDTPALTAALEALYHRIHQARLDGDLPRPNLRNLAAYHAVATEHGFDVPDTLSPAGYHRLYQTHLATIDAEDPLPPDDRIWPA